MKKPIKKKINAKRIDEISILIILDNFRSKDSWNKSNINVEKVLKLPRKPIEKNNQIPCKPGIGIWLMYIE